MLSETSSKDAPWFVIPADHKWYRNASVSQILIQAMESLKLRFPQPTFDPTGINLNKLSVAAAAKKAVALEAKS